MANRFRAVRQGDASAAVGTAKTLLRVLAGSGDPVTVTGFWVEFDSVASSDKPIKVQLRSETTAAAPTGTSVTPDPDEPSAAMGTASAAVLANCSAEGAATYATNDFEAHYVPATGGLYIQYPLGREKKVAANQAVRLIVTAVTTAVNCTAGITWEE